MTTTLSSLKIKLPRIGRTLGLSLLLLLSGFSGQGYADTLPAAKNAPRAEAARKVSFSKDIQPIFDTYCTFCHFGASAHGGLSLERGYAYWMLTKRPSVLSKAPGVVPGKPDESFLIQKLEFKLPGIGYIMPTGMDFPLKPDLIKLIRRWIEEGAADN